MTSVTKIVTHNYLKVFPNQEKPNNLIYPQLSKINILFLQNVSEKTLRNIDLIDSEKTIAVVTGQQLGIFGGPLYTIYKIITAIKLAKQLSERYDDYNFVPVFWLEADDHDFNEVRSINIFDNENQILNIGYHEGIDDDSC